MLQSRFVASRRLTVLQGSEMLFFVGLCLVASYGYVQGDCSAGCNQPTLMYDDLKCQPLFANRDDCCPLEYDCSNIVQRAALAEEKCYFHGKTYKDGELINDEEIYGNCKVNCRCTKKSSGHMGFTCAILDCPEWLGGSLQPGCYRTYELDKCCSVGHLCPPFSSTTCEVDGKALHEGDKFDAPDQKCTKCVCRAGFAGKFEAPFCKKRVCVDEVTSQEEIKKFCAPSYLDLGDCCPYHWICPKADDKIVPVGKAKNPLLKCKFGEETLDVGDKFERTSPSGGKLACECSIPPYLTCIQNYEYYEYE